MSNLGHCPFSSPNFPNNIAFDDGRRQFTFNQANVFANRLAANLTKLEVSPSKRIALLSDNTIEAALLVFAVQRAGLAIVFLNSKLRLEDWQAQCRIANCQPVISGKPWIVKLESFQFPIIDLYELINCQEFYNDAPTPDFPINSRIKLSLESSVIFTSGSSGHLKGVRLSLKNHFASAKASNANTGLKSGDRWLVSLPFYHVGGLEILYRCAIAGATAHILKAFDQKTVGDALRTNKITHISLVPTMLQSFLRDDSLATALSSLKLILLGGEPLKPSLLDEISRRNLPVMMSYGMTETTSHVLATAPGDSKAKLLTSGKPLADVELKIIDDEGKLCPKGIAGEILLRGPSIFSGYIESEQPQDTKQWFQTGDIGVQDSAGYVSIIGRSDDMFISGGENIHKREIERAAEKSEMVAKAAVITFPHQRWGVRPVLFVEKSQTNFSEEKFRDFLSKELSRIKQPDRIVALESLPQTAIGKTDYSALELLYSETE